MFGRIVGSIFYMMVDETDWNTNEENKSPRQPVGMFDKKEYHKHLRVENVVGIRKKLRMPQKTVHDSDRHGLVTRAEKQQTAAACRALHCAPLPPPSLASR